MNVRAEAKKAIEKVMGETEKLGDIKKLGKEIKINHQLAQELWTSRILQAKLLATLILDKKKLTEPVLEDMADDLMSHDQEERNQIGDWLLANQLTKDRKLVAMVESWEKNPSTVFRRWFWYHQARLRWTGKIPPNSADLLESLEKSLQKEEPEVQWAMNFCAGWIGVFEPKLRAKCIKIGETSGLYKDEPVLKNCTPAYLPEFIRIEVDKRQ